MVERSGMARVRPVADDPRTDPLGYWLDQEDEAWLGDAAPGMARNPAARTGDSNGDGDGADLAAPVEAAGDGALPAGWWILPALALALPAWALIGWLAFG